MSKFFEVKGPRGECLEVPFPTNGNEIWAVARRAKRNSCGRLYSSRSSTDVELLKVSIGSVALNTAYDFSKRDFDEEGTLVWCGTAYAATEEGFFRDVPICAGVIAKTEEEAKALLAFFQKHGLEFDANNQVKLKPFTEEVVAV